jgi:hypothetical protein
MRVGADLGSCVADCLDSVFNCRQLTLTNVLRGCLRKNVLLRIRPRRAQSGQRGRNCDRTHDRRAGVKGHYKHPGDCKGFRGCAINTLVARAQCGQLQPAPSLAVPGNHSRAVPFDSPGSSQQSADHGRTSGPATRDLRINLKTIPQSMLLVADDLIE